MRANRSALGIVGFFVSLGAIALAPAVARAQFRPLTTIGSIAEDRLRLSQLTDSAPTAGSLIRTASSMSFPSFGVRPPVNPSASGVRLPVAFIISPEFATTYNSTIPLSLNDGAMWSGRGVNTLVRAGVGFDSKFLTVIIDPEFTWSQNLPFEVFPGTAPGRSAWSSPWHIGNQSADLPLRFGDQQWSLASPGQSSMTLHAGTIDLGASTENQWWGPGVRNALLLSNQAEGVPHLFIKSAHPYQTGIGDIEWRIIAGALTESIYFDTISTNNTRSLSGFIVTLRPAIAPHVTLGVARIVVAPTSGAGSALHGAFDAFTQWHPAQTNTTPTTRADSLHGDQLLSLFGRWILPNDHLELYFEWAKSELPRSLRDFVIAPQDAQGYTLGMQWAFPARDRRSTFRVQAEATDVEQTTVFASYPTPDFYAGTNTAQGFTQRGQLLGASVGPGGQSQWLAGDYLRNAWSLGVMFERIRWEDNALYRQPIPNFFRHDVTLMAGVRGSLRTKAYDFSASIAANPRQSYLFQDGFANPGGRRTVDEPNLTITFLVSPR